MKPVFLSLIPNPPPGFETKKPTKRDLLSDSIALFSDSLESATSLLPDFERRVHGLVITPGDQFSQITLGPSLYHIVAPASFFASLRSMAASTLLLIAERQETLEKNARLTIELQRSLDTLEKTQTSYHETTERLIQRASEINRLFDLSMVGSFRTDLSGKIILANPALLEIIGYESLEDLNEVGVEGTYENPADRQRLINMAMQGPVKSFETRLLRKDGRAIDVLVSACVVVGDDDKARFLEGNIVDNMRQKEIERATTRHVNFLEKLERIDRVIRRAKSLEQMLSAVLQETLDIFAADRAWLLTPCDPDAPSWSIPMECTRAEYPGAFATGETFSMQDEVSLVLKQALETKNVITIDSREETAPKKTDARFEIKSQIHFAVHPLTGDPWLLGLHQCSHYRSWTSDEEELFREIGRRLGDGLSTMLVLQDQQLSNDLLEQERNMFVTGPVVVFKWENAENWPVEYVSPNVEDVLGYTPNELKSGKPIYSDLIHEDDLARVSTEVENGNHPTSSNFIHEPYRIIRKDGQVIWIDDFTTIIRNAEGKVTHFLGYVLDITKRVESEEARRLLERQLQHTQKLESLGVLAGGIAHDFNNLLMAILGNADLALELLSPMAPARNMIKEITRASHRAAELAKQMLAYSGKGRFVVEPINAESLLSEMAHLLEVSIAKNVVLKYNFESNVPSFDGDATQIRQVIMNLITNASEAIGDESGYVALSTGVMTCDRAYLESSKDVVNLNLDEPLPEGQYVYFEVADTGCGMSESTLKKIFDPFFTTKFAGRGLGMSAVLGIMRGHGGTIRIYSEEGKGTSFKVLFPANHASRSTKKKVTQPQKARDDWQGRGTILVVDDEETVRTVAVGMLDCLGFESMAASNGLDGVQAIRDRGNDISCVLLDLTMPHMDGAEAFREMRRIDPHVKVILCSGYNEQDATQRFSGKGLADFIQKPYSLRTLRESLRALLA